MYSENPLGEGFALFKTNETLAKSCHQRGISAEGSYRLKGPAWILPGFNPVATNQRETSQKVSDLLRILKEDVHGAKDEANNVVFSVTFDRIEATTNMTALLYQMSKDCFENAA